MCMSYIVYKFTNIINNKIYIGITSRTLSARKAQHIREAYVKADYNKSYNYPFKRAIRKYGIGNFTEEILETNLTENEAKLKEKYYIKKYNSYINFPKSNGYNATLGGDANDISKIPVIGLDPMSLDVLYKCESEIEAINIIGHKISDSLNIFSHSTGNIIWITKDLYD